MYSYFFLTSIVLIIVPFVLIFYLRKFDQSRGIYLISTNDYKIFTIHKSNCKTLNTFTSNILAESFDTYEEVWEFADNFEPNHIDCTCCNPIGLIKT